jgi:homocysteine S-methyltransferase
MTRVTIMDGGMGRQLKAMGAPFRRPEWSALALMEAPEFVTKAHTQYVEAGAEIIITNNYAVVPFHIGQKRFDEKGYELIELAAKLARKAADQAPHKVMVAGSVPPAFGSYRADLYIEEEADNIYLPHIKAQENYIDIWLAETISTVQEAKKINSLLKNSNKPLWLSFTVKDREEKDVEPQLRSGKTIQEAIETALELDAKALLFNCSQPEEISPVLQILKNAKINIPYGAYANAFEPIKKDQKANLDETTLREDTTPENYLEFAQEWKELGASIIGGCCGIGPEHIEKLRELNI